MYVQLSHVKMKQCLSLKNIFEYLIKNESVWIINMLLTSSKEATWNGLPL